MAYLDDQSVDPQELARRAAILQSLKPPTLDPNSARVPPAMAAPVIPVSDSGLMPSTLGNRGTDLSTPPGLSLNANLDPNDPKYTALAPHGKAKIGSMLEATIGGPFTDDAERRLNAPTLAYQKDVATQAQQAGQQKSAADLAETQARTQNLLSPPAKQENLDQQESDAVDDLVSQGLSRVDAIAKVVAAKEKPAVEKPGEYKPYTIPNSKTPVLASQVGSKLIGRDGQELPAGAVPYEKPPAPKDETDKENARLDRSYSLNSGQLEKERAPVEAVMGKIGSALSNINLQSPQADALLAPQILSLAAGGAGSGLRMNEAEISRILGGRTAWESLQSSINKYSTDPNHPQIPQAQRQQMLQIVQAAQAKGTQKQSILEWAEGKLIDADDVKAHRQVVQQAKQLLDAVDSGKRIQRNKTTGEFRIAPDEQ